MIKSIFVLGAGGHASVLVDILKQHELPISGLFSNDVDNLRNALSDIPAFTNEDDIFNHDTNSVCLVNGIGSLPKSELRAELYNKFSKQGYSFLKVISKQAIISSFATLGKGVQVMPGVVIQAGAVIGDNSIINTGAIIEHDCIIGKNCHVAPGATLSGQVTLGNSVHIGTGANIIQNISIEEGAILGAGATVFNDVSAGATVLGIKSKVK